MSCPPGRRAVAALISLLALAGPVAACSDDGPTSKTPQIQVGAPESPELFLAVEDVSVFPGFDGAELADVSDVPRYENPDPRGPCGGVVVEPPPLDGATAQGITGATISLLQLIGPASEGSAAYIAAMLADMQPTCGPYRSITNTGEFQDVSEIVAFEATGEGVEGAAWTSLLEIDNRQIYAGAIVVETDDRFTFVTVTSQTAIPQEAMELLAERTVVRLRGEA